MFEKREQKTRSGDGSKRWPTCKFFYELQFLTYSLKNEPNESKINATYVNKENTPPQRTDDDFTPKRPVPKRKHDNQPQQQQPQQQ